jgi:hypothetical protein
MPTILVRNASNTTQYFYLLQQQAVIKPSSSILSSCLGCELVGNYDSTGAQIAFSLDAQVYAGAKSTMELQPQSKFNAFLATSTSRANVTSTSAIMPVSLSGPQPLNSTNMTINPLGLSTPTNSDLASGTFGVAVPTYNQIEPAKLYCGNAVKNQDGSIVLSSFVAPFPNQTLTCKSEQIYYVKAGYQAIGSIVEYDITTTTNWAKCDFTSDMSTITVTYMANGTFTTTTEPTA